MRSILFMFAVVMASVHAGLIATTDCLALAVESDTGDWPTSWPKELEPYRSRAKTTQFMAGGGSDTYVITVLDSEDFDRLWPAVMKAKSKGGTITLSSGDKPEVRIVAPPYGLRGEDRGGFKYEINDEWLASVERTSGVLPDYASLDSEGKWRDSWEVARRPGGFKARIDVQLAVYGDVTSPGRIPLPPDTPIIDQRNTGREKPAEYAPRAAVQLYLWVQDRAKKKIDLWDDLDAVFGEVRQTGAPAIEGFLDWFSTDERARRTTALLEKHGLRVAGLYTHGALCEPDKAKESIDLIVDRAKRAMAVRPEFIDVNPDPLPGRARKTEEQLRTQARMLDELGKHLRKIRLQLLVHQHDVEILDNAREHRANLLWTDPRLVGFCLDTHWIYRAGQKPLVLLKEAGGRVRALHLRNSVNNVWSESFGPGDIDHEAITEYLQGIRYDGWLILELAYEPNTKVTRSLVDNVRQGLDYLGTACLVSTTRPAATTSAP